MCPFCFSLFGSFCFRSVLNESDLTFWSGEGTGSFVLYFCFVHLVELITEGSRVVGYGAIGCVLKNISVRKKWEVAVLLA